MKVAAFATIKMNSQRVPHKNIQPIGSRPLCYHIVHTALQIEKIDDVYVYCSDEVGDRLHSKGSKISKERTLAGWR
ncbi:MAG: cytidylyltransferase domain-containing protein [Enterocloster bolteae]